MDAIRVMKASQKNKGFVVTTCMTSVNPAKNTPQRMAQTKWRKGWRRAPHTSQEHAEKEVAHRIDAIKEVRIE